MKSWNWIVLLIVAIMAVTLGCDQPVAGPSPITIVNSNQNTNNSGPADSANLPPLTTNNILNLDPSNLELEVDRRAAVAVFVSTPGGVTVAAGDITATIMDPSVVMFSEVIGERVYFRGVNVGSTIVIVHAGGASAQLSVSVVPQS